MAIMRTHEPLELLENGAITIPAGIVDLQTFRDWTRSDDFPRYGRIDYIDGQIEVDMCPANIQFHSLPKSEIAIAVGHFVRSHDLGQFYIDQTRLISTLGVLSCEPDMMFISWKRINTGEIVFRESAKPQSDMDFMEIDGGPDLVVEVLSPSSIQKDTQRLKERYFEAGTLEYWLVDAMHGKSDLRIMYPGARAFKPAPIDRNGFQRSKVLGMSIKLICGPGRAPRTLNYQCILKK